MWIKIISDLQLGLALLLSGVFMGVFYFWKFDNGSSITSQVIQLESDKTKVQQEIDTLTVKLRNVQKMDQSMKTHAVEIAQLLKYIPNELTSSRILKHLNHLTKASGVHLEDIKNYGSVKKEKLYEKLRINMKIRGFFSQLLLFLSKITELNIFVTVEEFTIEHDLRHKRSRQLLNELRVSMDIYGYRYLPEIISENDKQK